jgi:hypothetical protein
MARGAVFREEGSLALSQQKSPALPGFFVGYHLQKATA